MGKSKQTSQARYSSKEIAVKIAQARDLGWKRLNLYGCHVQDNDLHELLGEPGVKHLRSLTLWDNQLSTLPPEITHLTTLTTLDLMGNQLSALPPEIVQLTALKGLYLSGNQLSTLPPEIAQLTALTTLHLSSNQLSTLPPEIAQLTALTTLHLSGNQLSTLPPEIVQLTALRMLFLSGNQLSTLPPEIGQLTALTTLNLMNNQLSTVPPEIAQLSALTKLDLSNNQLATLPEWLRGLSRLTALYLHANPALGLPDEVLGPPQDDVGLAIAKPKPPAEILDYYFRVQGESGRPLAECKLIVVGRGGAGKTSLVKRLNGEPFDLNESETHGITIQELDFQCREGKVTSRVWDFGGQVVLHSMHEFFLTARSLYLLVLGERDDMLERDAAYWLQLIRSYAGDAPVVVALNKSAGRQRQFDRTTLEKNYGPILGWVRTECAEPDATKGGISQLQQTLSE